MNKDILDQQNITVRKPPRCKSLMDLTQIQNDTSLSSTTLFDNTMESLPNISTTDDVIVLELRQKNENLTLKLESAHKEIENLLTENFKLKEDLENSRKVIRTLRQLNLTPSGEVRSSLSTPRRKINNPEKFKPLSDTLSPLLNTVNLIKHDSSATNSINSSTNENIETFASKEETSASNCTHTNFYMADTQQHTTKKHDGTNTCNSDNEKTVTITVGDPSAPKKSCMRNNLEEKDSFNNNMQEECKTRNKTDNIKIVDNKGCSNNIKESGKPKIIILGDQQASGLSALLAHKWKGRFNNDYSIIGLTKAFASSGDVLSYCNHLVGSFAEKDRVILCLGANDTNPFLIIKELCGALDKLKGTKVFIAPVNYNPTVSENVLNMHISSILKFYKNCILIKQDGLNLPHKRYLNQISDQVIHEISKIDYEDNYITSIRKHLQNLNSKCKMHKKGTIPYYFKPLSKIEGTKEPVTRLTPASSKEDTSEINQKNKQFFRKDSKF